MWLPPWAWLLARRHVWASHARPAVRWMNRFAFVGLAVGVFAWISVVSIMNGLQGDIKARVLQEEAHLLWEGTPRENLQMLPEQIRHVVGAELKSARYILQSEGLLEVPTSRQKARIAGSGVVIQGIEGLGTETHVGIELFAILGLAPGDLLRLRSVWKLNAIPLDLHADKIFESGVYDIDRTTIKIDRGKMERWLGLRGAISRIEIQLRDPMRAPAIGEQLRQATGIDFKPWEETKASLWYSLKLEKWVMTLAIFFIVILACLAVHLALAVRVAEKNREIALLRGLGADANILSRIFLTEGFLLGISGSATGLFLSWAFCALVSGYLKLPDFYYSTSVPVEWNWGTSIALTVTALALSLFASWAPARRVGSTDIFEALRS